MPEQKWCPFCLRPHSRIAATCSTYCARRIANHRKAVNSGRQRALARVEAQMRFEFVRTRRWREIAFGRNVTENLTAIFKP